LERLTRIDGDHAKHHTNDIVAAPAKPPFVIPQVFCQGLLWSDLSPSGWQEIITRPGWFDLAEVCASPVCSR
jgi:hypothetical protein